ncbi:YuzF family protein [Anaerobacillus alkaliphilus]|nr:YuzF family protein [Anaerobacillus alkaliphilus]
MYYGYDTQQRNMNTQYQTMIDPFVIETLQTVIGKHLVVETTRDSVRGVLKDVKPDHITLMAGDTPFFIRIQQIVTIMPIS